MIALAIGLGALFGVGLGMGLGRFFCKWHHKNDTMNEYPPGHPLGLSDDYSGPGPLNRTIGDEINGCDQSGDDCK